MDTFTNYLSMVCVIFLALYVGLIDMYYFLNVREKFRWIKFIYSIVAFYWASIYTYFVFNLDQYYRPDSRMFTRFGILLLLLSLSYGATVRLYAAKKLKGKV
jgi:hypothetical protein